MEFDKAARHEPQGHPSDYRDARTRLIVENGKPNYQPNEILITYSLSI